MPLAMLLAAAIPSSTNLPLPHRCCDAPTTTFVAARMAAQHAPAAAHPYDAASRKARPRPARLAADPPWCRCWGCPALLCRPAHLYTPQPLIENPPCNTLRQAGVHAAERGGQGGAHLPRIYSSSAQGTHNLSRQERKKCKRLEMQCRLTEQRGTGVEGEYAVYGGVCTQAIRP